MKKSFANYLSVLVEDLFFSPEDQVYWSPEHAGLNGQKLPTLSDEGTVLRLTKPNIEAKDSVIYFHDGSKNLTAHIPETAWLCELGLEVYLFDIRESEDDKGFPIESYIRKTGKLVDRILQEIPQEQKVLFSGNFIGAYGALENVSKASEQAAGLILHNCPYSFRSYMLANYGLGQAMSALLASDYQDPYVLVSEIKDVPIVVTYQNTGRLPISEFNKFRKTELPNLSYIEFPAKAPAQTVNKETEELRERIIKFFDTRTTS
jgi:hypothetical protein